MLYAVILCSLAQEHIAIVVFTCTYKISSQAMQFEIEYGNKSDYYLTII